MKKLLIAMLMFFFINSCQPIEKLDQVVFDNNQFPKFKILSKTLKINDNFDKKISEPYIGYTLEIGPFKRINNWLEENFENIGNENIFVINILDASITQKKFENKEAKNFDEKTNYKYEIFYLIEFNLFDDSNNLLASTLVESSRATTSGLYISIQEKENIINDLIYQNLNDLSYESKKLLSKYMSDYIL